MSVRQRHILIEVPGWPRAAMPAVELSNPSRGPVVTVVAGLGGTAYAGIEVARRAIDFLADSPLTGKVIVVPICDVAGFLDRSAYFSTLDGTPLIRVFDHFDREADGQSRVGVDRERSGSAGVARAIMNLVSESDIHVEIRGGELPEAHCHWVAELPPSKGRSRPKGFLAKAARAGFELMLDTVRNGPVALGSAGAASRMGIPSVIVSGGGPPYELDRDAELLVNSLTGILRAIEVLPAVAADRGRDPPRIGPEHWSHFAQQRGLWIAEVSAGEAVGAGQRIGQIVDYFGDRVEDVVTPMSGWVLAVTTSLAVGGEKGVNWFEKTVTIVGDAQ